MDTVNIFKRLIQQAYTGRILVILFLAPVAAFGISVLFSLPSPTTVSIGIIDDDNSALSAAFVRLIDASEHFRVPSGITNTDDMLEALRNGDIAIGMRINAGFYDNLENYGAVELFQVQGIQTFRLVEMFLNSSIDNLVLLKMTTPNEAAMVDRLNQHIDADLLVTTILENENAHGVFSTTAFGFLMMFMLLVATLSSKLMADDRFSRTIQRIFVSPVAKRSYILAGYFANLFFQLVQVAVIIAISVVAGFTFSIPLYATAVLLIAFSVFASFFGMWIGFVSKSVNQMIITSQMFVLPGILLCGTFFSFSLMPQALQRVAFIFPQTWVMQGVENYASTFATPYFAWMAAYFAALCLAAVVYLLVVFKRGKVGGFY